MSAENCIPSEVKNRPWVWARYQPRKIQSTPPKVDPNKIGKWMIFLNKEKKDHSGLTELDKAWFSITTLAEEKVLHGAKCSTAMSGDNYDQYTGVIICYTRDYTDKTEVQEAGKAINRIVQLKSPMYYKTDNATRAGAYIHLGHKSVSIYRFCRDGTFYERGANSSWIQIGSSSSESLVPSKVTWFHWLWAGPEIIPGIGDEKIGKWLLFLDQAVKDSEGLTELDKAWPSVASLVTEGILRSVRCCTAATPSYSDPTVGEIACYTSDYTDKKDVKEVADAIRKSIRSSDTMYYKTDEASSEGMYSYLEHEKISIYMYWDCKLYEKDEELRWKLVLI